MKAFFYCLLFLVITSLAWGAEKNRIPRFVSLKSNKTNVRVGPGANYPIEWVFVRARLPLEITAEFERWRKIRALDGTEGWVHQNMLVATRRGIIQGESVLVYHKACEESSPLARLQKGVIVDLLKCQGDWCYIRVETLKGWVPQSVLWGAYKNEIFS